jgi:heterodisulfide reductase subunit B
MKYALFLGCKIPSRLPAYAASTRAVLEHLGVTLVGLEFNCCGYPERDVSRDAFVLSAARNLALVERAGLNLLTPCACCFGTLRQAISFLDEDPSLRSRVTQALAAEDLAWSGKVQVEHILPLLAQVIGEDALAAAVRAPRAGLQVAAQYGCHTLRPGNVARFDNPMAPTAFETLIRLTGATPIDWPRRLDCCGDPLHGANTPLSMNITRAKIADAQASGAQVLCTACPHCHLRFDGVQADMADPTIRPLLVTQLLGIAMGLSEGCLGLG